MKDNEPMHEGRVHWDSSDRMVQIFDQEVSNPEIAEHMEEECNKGGVTPKMASSSIVLQAPAVGSSLGRNMLG